MQSISTHVWTGPAAPQLQLDGVRVTSNSRLQVDTRQERPRNLDRRPSNAANAPLVHALCTATQQLWSGSLASQKIRSAREHCDRRSRYDLPVATDAALQSSQLLPAPLHGAQRGAPGAASHCGADPRPYDSSAGGGRARGPARCRSVLTTLMLSAGSADAQCWRDRRSVLAPLDGAQVHALLHQLPQRRHRAGSTDALSAGSTGWCAGPRPPAPAPTAATSRAAAPRGRPSARPRGPPRPRS